MTVTLDGFPFKARHSAFHRLLDLTTTPRNTLIAVVSSTKAIALTNGKTSVLRITKRKLGVIWTCAHNRRLRTKNEAATISTPSPTVRNLALTLPEVVLVICIVGSSSRSEFPGSLQRRDLIGACVVDDLDEAGLRIPDLSTPGSGPRFAFSFMISLPAPNLALVTLLAQDWPRNLRRSDHD